MSDEVKDGQHRPEAEALVSKLVELDANRAEVVAVMHAALAPTLKRVRAGKRLNERQWRALTDQAKRLGVTTEALLVEIRAHTGDWSPLLRAWLARMTEEGLAGRGFANRD